MCVCVCDGRYHTDPYFNVRFRRNERTGCLIRVDRLNDPVQMRRRCCGGTSTRLLVVEQIIPAGCDGMISSVVSPGTRRSCYMPSSARRTNPCPARVLTCARTRSVAMIHGAASGTSTMAPARTETTAGSAPTTRTCSARSRLTCRKTSPARRMSTLSSPTSTKTLRRELAFLLFSLRPHTQERHG